MHRIGKPLTKKQLAAFAKLSIPANRLFTRLMEGKHYKVAFGNESRYWRELVDSGLVVHGGRIVTMHACYLPVGTKPFVCETMPTWPPMVIGEPKRGTP